MITFLRRFSTTRLVNANRAIVYNQNGDPTSVISVRQFPPLPAPAPNTVNIKFRLSPINPADLNVIQGVYPDKPVQRKLTTDPVFVAGNEGLGIVTSVGDGVTHLSNGDWVVMTKSQSGTWSTGLNAKVEDILKISSEGLSDVQAATITINPATAYCMLKQFVDLKQGDWVLQNGANSAVGQAAIQIAAARGIKTINVIRDRPNVDELKSRLFSLGATHVVTEQELEDKALKTKVQEWTDNKLPRLFLNCVSGKSTSLAARLLGSNAHIVSYGAMSMQPLSLPTSLFIFKNLTTHGFWMSRWYKQASTSQRQDMLDTLTNWVGEGKLQGPSHEILKLSGSLSDAQATETIQNALKEMSKGRYGKKVLLSIEETP